MRMKMYGKPASGKVVGGTDPAEMAQRLQKAIAERDSGRYYLTKERPRDFYGPDDWLGGDPEEEAAAIRVQQGVWDEHYARLTYWEKILFFFTSDGVWIE